MAHNIKYIKYLCCMNLTLATRIIAAIGLAIGFVLSIALIHEKTNDEEYYGGCIKIALALGLDLDWFHINSNSTTSYEVQERVTIIVLTTYSILYLITNMLLLLATILLNKSLTIPWFVCEFLHCTSKFAGLVYHLIKEREHTKNIYIIGSVIYISLMLWWMLVVFFTQKTWTYRVKLRVTMRPLKISLSSVKLSPKKYHLYEIELNQSQFDMNNVSVLESPISYNNNNRPTYPSI